MYGEGKGADPISAVAVVTGGVILPNTGDNKLVMALALTSIAIGVTIIASTIVRMVVKKAHKA